MAGKEIEIIIDKENESIEIDQIGYHGKECSGAIDDLITAIGSKKKVQKKKEFADRGRVRVRHDNS